VAIAFWYFSRPAGRTQVASLESVASSAIVKEVQRSVSNPTPLIATGTRLSAPATGQNANTLTRAGIVAATNIQRTMNGGLASLSENVLLDQIASERLDDMIAKQYFAHVSPSSSSAETVAKTDGYNYIALGENLALGNFKGDTGVVAAWMASPGHRANILNTRYTEIGVAAKKTIFDGAETWLAVQIFGRPASDCPAPDAALKPSIDVAEAQLMDMWDKLKTQQAAIDVRPRSGAGYNNAVSSYNALAAAYNVLLGETKTNISSYNVAIKAYNTCIGD
jgi:uncharacterized protein YkwD